MPERKLVIVSGMSGAGRSQVLNMLEDAGFYCVDNIPVELLGTLLEVCRESSRSRVGVGMDVRSAANVEDLAGVYRSLPERVREYSVLRLFLDADDRTLINRFSETRRRHPLGGSLPSALRRERRLLEPIRSESDAIISTSAMTLAELKSQVAQLVGVGGRNLPVVWVVSFGFKNGVPINADFVFDTRFLPNPNYVERLRPLTGKTAAVRRYVLRFAAAREYRKRLFALMDFAAPLFFAEGKSYVTIAMGCTGGRHRSVVFAELLYRHLRSICSGGRRVFDVKLVHRDIERHA